MSSYHFKKDKKFKKRRILVTATVFLSVIAIAMGSYLLSKNKSVETDAALLTPADSTTAPSSDTAVPTDTQPPADSTAQATTSTAKNGVETKDHGFLPNFDSVEDSGKMEELEDLIKNYTSNLPGKYGVTFIDLATGEIVDVNDKVEYIAASTSKLPINVLLYENIEAGKVDLDDMLTYEDDDFEAGTGIIQKSPFGTQYTVRETSKLAVTKSDNCGVNMLIRLLGIENVRKYIQDLGGQVYYGPRHRSCPYDMALVAKQLYNLYLKNESVYGELINNLENTDWHDRIDAKLPKEVQVAHKIGNQVKTANDVGIVFASHPYVLSIMTDNVDFGTACNSIAGLSKKIYDFTENYAGKTSDETKQ